MWSRRVLLLAALVALVFAACGKGADTSSESRFQADGSTDPQASAEAYRALPLPPGPARSGSLTVPAGDSIVALGGDELSGRLVVRAAEGASIYSPQTNEWAALDLPFSPPRLLRPGAVWTGDRLIIAGVPCGENYPEEDTEPLCLGRSVEVASYSPEDGTWDKLPGIGEAGRSEFGPAPFVQGVGWTGRYAVFKIIDEDNRYMMLDPSTNQWTEVSGIRDSLLDTLCVIDGGVYSVNQPGDLTGSPSGSVEGTILTDRYEPETGEWQRLEDHPLPSVGQAFTHVVCENGEMVLLPGVGPEKHSTTEGLLWFDSRRGSWDSLPPIPETFATVTPARVGDARVLWPGSTGQKYWILEGNSRWIGTSKPAPGDSLVRSNGQELLVETPGAETSLSLVDPKRYATEQAAPR